MFFMPLGASIAFCHRDKGGGVAEKSCGGVTATTFLEVFCFLWFDPDYSASIMTIQKNQRKTIATPPRNGGGMLAPCSGAHVARAPITGPQGVAIVGIYPCGKARKRRPGAGRIKRRMALWNCGRTIGN